MSSNFTSDSPLHHNQSSVDFLYCLKTKHGSIVFFLFFITNSVLLLPSCILILNLGFRRWRQQRTTSPASAVQSSLDIFSNHYAVIELLMVASQLTCSCGILTSDVLTLFSFYVLRVCWIGETSFQILLCLERYLAVVHPLVYMKLRGETGLRIRNTILLLVWLLCALAATVVERENVFDNLCLSYVLFSFIVEALCSLMVLRALVRSRPGEQGQKREKVDQSKKMALYNILAILGSQSLKLFSYVLWFSFVVTPADQCIISMFEVWLIIPSHQVLPLLILQKAGKLKCCKYCSK